MHQKRWEAAKPIRFRFGKSRTGYRRYRSAGQDVHGVGELRCWRLGRGVSIRTVPLSLPATKMAPSRMPGKPLSHRRSLIRGQEDGESKSLQVLGYRRHHSCLPHGQHQEWHDRSSHEWRYGLRLDRCIAVRRLASSGGLVQVEPPLKLCMAPSESRVGQLGLAVVKTTISLRAANAE